MAVTGQTLCVTLSPQEGCPNDVRGSAGRQPNSASISSCEA